MALQVSCAILWAQLEQAQTITAARLANFEKYRVALAPLAAKGYFKLLELPAYSQHNAHIFYIVLPSLAKRQDMEKALKKRGISAFSHYVPLHSSPAGLRFGRVGCKEMTVTRDFFNGLLRLPVWVGLKPEEIEYVIHAVHESCAELYPPLYPPVNGNTGHVS